MSYEIDCDLALLTGAELLDGLNILEECAVERDDVLEDAIGLAERALFAMKEEQADIARSYKMWEYEIYDEIKLRLK